MPELPEVEMVVRAIRPRLVGQKILRVEIIWPRSLRNVGARKLTQALERRTIRRITRRAKFIRFGLDSGNAFLVHLGMRGRLLVANSDAPLPRHVVVAFHFGGCALVFNDPRRFGRIELGDGSLAKLGPEPFGKEFSQEYLAAKLRGSRAPIKARLLDQSLAAGIGNIYACEALFVARIHPRAPAGKLDAAALRRLHGAICRVLRQALRFGSTIDLDVASSQQANSVFYFGGKPKRNTNLWERFFVYDREGQPCRRCRVPIAREEIGGRGTFFCSRCQR